MLDDRAVASQIESVEEQLRLVMLGDAAYVSVLARLSGSFADKPFHRAWQIVAGQASIARSHAES